MKRRFAVIALVLFASCAGNLTVFTTELCDTLYFGTEKPDGGVVSDAEWQRFLADVVTPRFPEGFTTWDANGQWRDKKGVIEHERTHILMLLNAHDALVREVIAAYKQQFAQESVLRLNSEVGLPNR